MRDQKISRWLAGLYFLLLNKIKGSLLELYPKQKCVPVQCVSLQKQNRKASSLKPTKDRSLIQKRMFFPGKLWLWEPSEQNQLRATESTPEVNSGRELSVTTWLPQITHKFQR